MANPVSDLYCIFCGTFGPPHEHDVIEDARECVVCSCVFGSMDERNSHFEEAHYCAECGFVARNKTELKQHKNFFHLRYSCKKCNDKFNNEKDMKKHYKKCAPCKMCVSSGDSACECEPREHSFLRALRGETSLTCHLCFESCTDMHEHLIENHYCDLCSAMPHTREDLHQHRFHLHGIPLPIEYPCSRCPATFTTERSLIEHEKNAHQIPFRCRVCQEEFPYLTSLMRHMRSCRRRRRTRSSDRESEKEKKEPSPPVESDRDS